ncbi:thiosulfate oxidation carrier protein SoxY [Sulfitobacter sp. JBTF-M27]|uniref:Thiosulfate oxidation carrier protein SoxY n=1 Tax=Sulfitobacter sediminilitoris TaxID=2698830 RepID=A0A6P0C4Y1_9RHOB|nr:thiosulfate oxidation carrier protein SoxY [Sulfitobacter sediminilitoris]NEK21209.1 thiosulfate oxidation carrier protein SoxY [Sulfitobacter sediminilitoris]
MELTRRNMLVISSGTALTAALGALPAFASMTDDEIAKITGGADTAEGAITLTAPEIAENGNTVPIEVAAPGATMVALFADGNPTPKVATIKFGPLNPTNAASTRIRLAGTQNVVAIAQMEDGTFQKASANVKVTIGGCGG